MFREALIRAFDDMFEHLGEKITFLPRRGSAISIVAVIKNPENIYELGDSNSVEQIATVAVKAHDVTPRIGDTFVHESKTYKIYKEPLLDASNYIWKFEAVLIGG